MTNQEPKTLTRDEVHSIWNTPSTTLDDGSIRIEVEIRGQRFASQADAGCYFEARMDLEKLARAHVNEGI